MRKRMNSSLLAGVPRRWMVTVSPLAEPASTMRSVLPLGTTVTPIVDSALRNSR
ncbi:MAG: hypothetical protein R2939_18785 [Kofleriaceae bacterium]